MCACAWEMERDRVLDGPIECGEICMCMCDPGDGEFERGGKSSETT